MFSVTDFFLERFQTWLRTDFLSGCTSKGTGFGWCNVKLSCFTSLIKWIITSLILNNIYIESMDNISIHWNVLFNLVASQEVVLDSFYILLM